MHIDLKLLHQGKVRDIYDINTDLMLIVTSDRISAFDVIFTEIVPEKGKILTTIANFWFNKTQHIVSNHLTNIPLTDFLPQQQAQKLQNRTIIVQKLKPLPIEAIVRGYLIGSGWIDYQKNGNICGVKLPKNLQLAQQLDHSIYTPSSKANVGKHDENISFKQTISLIGQDLAEQVRNISIDLYEFARDFADTKGIIIADTKFEFGINKAGELVVMDEILTPDSSRFWDKAKYKIGESPASFDKQILRDYLVKSTWDKALPPPKIPDDIIQKTANKYREVKRILVN